MQKAIYLYRDVTAPVPWVAVYLRSVTSQRAPFRPLAASKRDALQQFALVL
jgi:hypothetical protein